MNEIAEKEVINIEEIIYEIIIDRNRVFHSGTSFKDLGKKCFGINEIES